MKFLIDKIICFFRGIFVDRNAVNKQADDTRKKSEITPGGETTPSAPAESEETEITSGGETTPTAPTESEETEITSGGETTPAAPAESEETEITSGGEITPAAPAESEETEITSGGETTPTAPAESEETEITSGGETTPAAPAESEETEITSGGETTPTAPAESEETGMKLDGETTPAAPTKNQTKKPPIGGKRGGPQKPKRESSQREARFIPQLICKEEKNKWGIAVEDDERIESVIQNGKSLCKNGKFYELPKINNLTINLKTDESKSILLPGNRPIIFQTNKNWKHVGRKVKTIFAHSYYIVFSPISCGKRTNNAPPIEKEETNYEGWKAHFFAPNENVNSDGFEYCDNIISAKEQFILEGRKITEHANMGDLFAEHPHLQDKINNFNDVSEIHIGEEKKSGWSISFNPQETTIAEVLENRGGWFFVRIYDKDYTLISNPHFRFLPGLSNITINDNENWAKTPIAGCKVAKVKFHEHRDGDSINIFLLNNINLTQCEANCYIIPSDDTFDITKWKITKNGYSVDITLILPRIRWQNYHAKEENWITTPIKLKSSFLRNAKHTHENIVIRCPRYIKKIYAGIGELDKAYKGVIQKNDNWQEFNLPLIEFIDHIALENTDKIPPLCIQFDANGGDNNNKIPILKIINDKIKKSEPHKPLPPPIKKQSLNQGFSKKELEKARINRRQLRDAKLPYDKRRRSCWSTNVRKLLQFIEESNND